MDLSWFRMRDVRSRKLDSAVWIPLLVSEPGESGSRGTVGFEEDFVGLATLAVPLAQRGHAENLGWDLVGLSHSATASATESGYVASDVFEDPFSEVAGLWLVLNQRGNLAEHAQWHLHQDFVIALALLREGDTWLAMDEGYVEVARLRRSQSGAPRRIEVKSEFLKDYLCARGMALYVSSYRNRTRLVDPHTDVPWLAAMETEELALTRWEGSARHINEHGLEFGAETAVFHVSRTDIPVDEDVPILGTPGSGTIESKSWSVTHGGKKLLRVQGDLWHREWIEPAPASPRVRGDRLPSTTSFIVDAGGTRASDTALRDGGRWLWFRPDVIAALAHRRGGSLGWYTRNTGCLAASPGTGVHFGLNEVGLVTAYAKDVALLPEWQQRIWAGHNVTPEGGISDELHASQVRAKPAHTLAPEAYLGKALNELRHLGLEHLGRQIIREHDEHDSILARTHRFRALDAAGLCSLAKDVARLTADSLDISALQKIVAPPKGEKWGSLKSLEKVLGRVVSADDARKIMAPLVGAYELRHGDAHLSGDLDGALKLVGIDTSLPFVHQGAQLLIGCMAALTGICECLRQFGKSTTEQKP